MEGSSEAEGIHARAQGGFSAYLDGELPDAERKVVEEHLAVCIQCRTELTRLRAAVQQLGALREKAPRSFLSDIQKQINTRSKGRFFGRRRLLFGRIPFEWVSLAMIVAMLVYYIITQHGSPTQVAPGP
jgi:anti-sigma factor RsiW